MVQEVFLILGFLLHFSKADICHPDNCPGIIISGGRGAETSIETFPAEANCSIPSFPEPGRSYHSLSLIKNGQTIVACGGEKTRKDCISWQNGQSEWTHYANLSQERFYHGAVVLQDDTIMLVGGKHSTTTGEIVKGGIQFPLQSVGYGTCTIPYQNELLMIGGDNNIGSHTRHGKVDRYDSKGNYLGSLPQLDIPRLHHACAGFVTAQGEQALLVTGGVSKERLQSSTELYIPSNRRWISGARTNSSKLGLNGPQAAYLNQHVVVTGGHDAYRYRNEFLQYDAVTDSWAEIGQMERGRSFHAIVQANLGDVCAPMGTSTEVPTETLITTEASGKTETTSSLEAGTSTEESAETLITTEVSGKAETTSRAGLGEAGTITIRITDLVLILAIPGSLLLLALLICLTLFFLRRRILSTSFKNDVNNDYGIYPESADAVMEVVDQNAEYQATGDKKTNVRRVSDYDNMYDKMG